MDDKQYTEELAKNIGEKLRGKQTALKFDNTPTEGSVNPVTSEGIKEYVDKHSGEKYLPGDNISIDENGVISATVNDSGITITQDGIEKGTFTLNQKINQTIDLQGFTGIDVVKNVGFYKKTWSWNPSPQNSISENDFWSDPQTGKLYYSNNSDQYVFNETTSIWERKIWKGLTNFTADYIWSDNEDIYYSYGDSQYRLNRNTDTWATLNWKFDSNTKFNGWRTDIWFDGEHAYYDTNGGLHYVLDKNNLVWKTNIWSNIEVVSPIEGRYIWTDHENNVYLNRSSSYIQSYKLDKTTNAWISVSWRSDTGTTYLNKNYIWHDNRNTYYSDPSHHYIVNIKNQILTTIDWKCINTEVNLRFTSSVLIFNNKTNNIFLLDVVDYDSLENYYSLENVYEKVFNLEKVAKTGNYDDLLNKPIIEKVNNATINLIQNEDIKGSFNLNQTNNQDIELEDAGKLLKAGKNININYYDNPSKVSSKTWFGELPKPLGRYIWTDGENIYYSNNTSHYVLDKTTSTWAVKTWNGLTSFKGDKVWTDGDNVYVNKYKLDKSTNTWNLKSDWRYVDADYIWLYKGIVYYSSYSDQYFLNKETDNWEPKTWTGLTSFSGSNIWTDGENCYYTLVGPRNKDYILEADGETWTEITFINRPFTSAFTTNNIFNIGGNTYVMYDLVGPYKLDKNNKRWSYIEFNWPRAYRNGYNIWSDGKTTYYSSGDEQYKFVFDEYEIENTLEKVSGTNDGSKWTSLTIGNDTYNITEPYLAGEGINIENNTINATGEVNVLTTKFSSSWNSKTWTGLTSFNGRVVWTDGENIYYSNTSSSGADNYVLDKKTSTWKVKTWQGMDLDRFYGMDIWKDGNNIYYSLWSSAGTDNYILDKTTSTWSKIIFSGYNDLSGRDIWTDGNNIYNSDGEEQYVLDKSTSTWLPKTWQGCTSFKGVYIWNDGENIYLSDASGHYVLDKSTSTWNVKNWNGLTDFYGDKIWTDGDNIYYSSNYKHYILDKATSTWTQKTWIGLPNFYGWAIWSDGENIYYSDDESQYELSHMTHKVTTLSKVAETGSYDDLKDKPVIPDLSNLFKIDDQGNVYINKGFKDVYTLAETFDETKTYYESYIPLDPTKLAGTWKIDSTKYAGDLPRVTQSFNEGEVMTPGTSSYIYYVDRIDPSSGTIINYMYVHYYNEGQQGTNAQPMVVSSNWNMSGISFTIENETMFNMMTNFFIKVSERVLSDDLLTIADVQAYDRAHPSYREIELTSETFVPNTYYVYESLPDWVNLKDIFN